MNLLGIDVGEKRIGLAVAESNNQVAVPLEVIKNDDTVKEQIRKIIDYKKIGRVVVGMPYTLKGEKGIQAERVFEFVKKNIKPSHIDIVFEDERFTSKIPLKNVSGKENYGKSKKAVRNTKLFKKHIDGISACIILQDYLDKIKKEKR